MLRDRLCQLVENEQKEEQLLAQFRFGSSSPLFELICILYLYFFLYVNIQIQKTQLLAQFRFVSPPPPSPSLSVCLLERISLRYHVVMKGSSCWPNSGLYPRPERSMKTIPSTQKNYHCSVQVVLISTPS